MFFGLLGEYSAKRAPVIIAVWAVLLLISVVSAPEWSSVVKNGEFAFLPPDSPSRLAEQGFRTAFPEDMLESSIVLVVRREIGDQGLESGDRDFIVRMLVPELHRIAKLPLPTEEDELLEIAGLEQAAATTAANPSSDTSQRSLVHRIQWFEDQKIGDLLDSEDGKASLVVVQLTTEFLDQANAKLVNEIEAFVSRLYRTPVSEATTGSIPAGLDIAISGSATFGRDMMTESLRSAKATEKWTVILVVVLLIMIYRAPLLALIPLITVGVSTDISLKLLSIAAEQGWLELFNGIETYVTVVVYGAGIDFGLFLMARYREELDNGATIEEAISRTLRFVGPAVATSAGTSIFGIGMMVFAEFGKFRQAGIAITFGLFICLVASVTLTPSIIRVLGRWAFWPNVPMRYARGETGFLFRTSWINRLQRANLLQQGWQKMAHLLERRPGIMWLVSILFLLPFAVIGAAFLPFLSYGLLSELPSESTSVRGTEAVQAHFPAGEVGPVYVLIEAPDVDFRRISSRGPEKLIGQLTQKLEQNSDRLGLHSVRSLSSPKGDRTATGQPALMNVGQRSLARKYFVSKENPSVTRLDLTFRNDPFSRTSIEEFRRLRDEFPALLPDELKNSIVSFKGPTANVSDLKDVTDRDQIRIDLLVLISVYAVLVLLLRRPGICAYLILSVFYSYFATLGFTFFVFWAMDPANFSGLDWKVPLFLFTILIAVGEDYNIFLMTRVDEERKVHGPVKGVTSALERTGSIISSCGIIMAGTFSSLMAGSLVGMHQLGFALAVGVLVDTFIVRPIMVPSFLILLAQGRLGILSRLSGSQIAMAAYENDVAAAESNRSPG